MDRLNFSELNQSIIEWANQRGLINKEYALKQTVKLIEEIGETASAVLKGDIQKQKDGIGDIYVVITILDAQLGVISTTPKGLKETYSSPEYGILDMITNVQKQMLDMLEMLSNTLGLDLNECVNLAYNEIKNREGELVDGTFIKKQ